MTTTVTVGTEVPEYARTTDLANWNRYAAVNDEFVPIHMDDDAGRAAGFPSAFGASRVVDPTAEAVGTGYDVVFECVGVPGMVDVAVGAAGLHDRVVIVGVCTQPDPFVPISAVLKEITMDFVVYYTRPEFAYVVDAFGHGVIDPRPFVTERVGLDGVDGAFRELDDSRSQCKILVLPGS